MWQMGGWAPRITYVLAPRPSCVWAQVGQPCLSCPLLLFASQREDAPEPAEPLSPLSPLPPYKPLMHRAHNPVLRAALRLIILLLGILLVVLVAIIPGAGIAVVALGLKFKRARQRLKAEWDAALPI